MCFLIQWKSSVGDVYVYIYIYIFFFFGMVDIVSAKFPLCVVIVVIWIDKINS